MKLVELVLLFVAVLAPQFLLASESTAMNSPRRRPAWR